jgi:hypothetical protein
MLHLLPKIAPHAIIPVREVIKSWGLSSGLPNWNQNVGTEHRQKLPYAKKKYLHILAVGLRKF